MVSNGRMLRTPTNPRPRKARKLCIDCQQVEVEKLEQLDMFGAVANLYAYGGALET